MADYPVHENYEPLPRNDQSKAPVGVSPSSKVYQALVTIAEAHIYLQQSGSSRELSLAKTKLEEARHWINAHLEATR